MMDYLQDDGQEQQQQRPQQPQAPQGNGAQATGGMQSALRQQAPQVAGAIQGAMGQQPPQAAGAIQGAMGQQQPAASNTFGMSSQHHVANTPAPTVGGMTGGMSAATTPPAQGGMAPQTLGGMAPQTLQQNDQMKRRYYGE